MQAGTAVERRRRLLERRLRGGTPQAPVPRVQGRDRPFPLSTGQERLWFLDTLAPGSTEWIVPVVLQAQGRLDLAALQCALDGLAARHEALRTAYVLVDGVPHQQVRPPGPVPVEVCPVPAPEVVDRALARSFDLTTGGLLRAAVARGDRDDVVVLTTHHIAADGWSVDLMVADLTAGYAAARGLGPEPAAPELQYLDWAVWTRAQARPTDALARRLERLQGIRPLELPTDRPRPAERDPAAGRWLVELDPDSAEQVRACARAHRTTTFAVLLAGLGLALARRSGQDRVFVGTPVAGRPRAQLTDVVGFFAETAIVPLDPGRGRTVAGYLATTREGVLDALADDGVGFDQLVAELAPDRDLSRNALVDVLFVVEGRPATDGARSEASAPFEPRPVPPASVKCDLIVGVRDDGTGPLAAAFDYATALFDQSSVAGLAADWRRCLAVLAGPDLVALDDVPLTTDGETTWLGELAGPVLPVPEVSLTDLVREQARRTPGRVAVEDADRSMDYAELLTRAGAIAARLPAGPPGVVAVCLERGCELLATLLGVMGAGHAYVPLDPDHPADRLAALVEDVAPLAVLTTSALRDRLPPQVPGLLVLDAEPAPPVRETAAAWAASAPGDLAYVLHTSGSTGRPKGVMVPHAGIVNRLRWMQRTYGLQPDDRVLQKTPTTFDVSVWELFWPLLVGARVVFAPPGLHLEPGPLAAFATARGITHLHFVPSMLDLFCELTPAFPPSVREVFCSGEALRAATVRRLAQRSTAHVHNLYGPTEASVDVTARRVADPVDPVPIGRPVDNTEVLVLDRTLRRTPPGVLGELYLAGVQLARGYRDRPDLTADRFVPHPEAPGARMYRTGDRGYVDRSGEVVYAGRADDQVKLRGVRIEPGEVEAALAAQPGVTGAGVVVVPDARAEPVLVGYVAGPESLDLDRVRASLAAALPPALVPAVLVRLAALPLGHSGKTDRRALRERPLPRRVAAPRSTDPADQATPPDPLQTLVLDAFTAAIGQGPVTLDDGFFAVGGDSMRAVRAVARLRDQGLGLSVADLFRHPSARALADHLRTLDPDRADREPAVAPPPAPFALLAPGDRERLPAGLEDAYPLAQLQIGMIFEMLGDPDLAPYRNVTSYPVGEETPFDGAAFARAVGAVTARHPMLRTAVDLVSGSEPLQLIFPEAAVDLDVLDLRDHPDPYAVVRADAAAERARPFELDRAPLWRLRVHVVSDQEWWLTEVECHVILDGWSHNLVLAEILATYRAALRDEPLDRPPPDRSFAELIAAERAAVADPAELDYWRRVWSAAEGPVLQDGWGSATDPAFAGAERDVSTLTEPIDALAGQLGVPRKSVLLAATAHAVAVCSGVARPTLGVISQSRTETAGGDEVAGMFLNMLPFHPSAAAPSWRGLIHDTFRTEVEMLPHRRFPFTEMYRRGLAPERAIQVSFNYLDFYTLAGTGVGLLDVIDDSPNEFPLVVTVVPGGLRASVHSRVLSVARADELLAVVEQVLRAMLADPDAPCEVVGRSWTDPDRVPLAPGAGPDLDVGSPEPAGPRGPSVDPGHARWAVLTAWARVLPDVAASDLDDDSDLGALGGSSLDAMRIAAMLQASGFPVGPRDLMHARTLGAVVALAAGGTASTASSDPVVQLTGPRPGRPWVLVHPGDGSVHWFRELVAALPGDRPVVALQHPGLVDPTSAGLGVEALAARYAEALEAHGIGPGADLLGWCGGGPVTWELARRWRAAGHDTVVQLLDPSIEALADTADTAEQVRLLSRCADLLAEGQRTGDADRWTEAVPLLRLLVLDERAHAFITVDPAWDWLTPVQLWRDLAAARLPYAYPDLDAEVAFILSDELVHGQHVARAGTPLQDYLDRFGGRLPSTSTVHRISGSHVGVLQPPHVEALAALMTRLAAGSHLTAEPR